MYVHAWEKHDKQSYFMLNKVSHYHLIFKNVFTLASIQCIRLWGGIYWTVHKFLLFLFYLFFILLCEEEIEEQTVQFCWSMDIQEVNTQFSSGQMHHQGIQKVKKGKQTARGSL